MKMETEVLQALIDMTGFQVRSRSESATLAQAQEAPGQFQVHEPKILSVKVYDLDYDASTDVFTMTEDDHAES